MALYRYAIKFVCFDIENRMRSICDGNEPVSFTFVCDMFAVKITKKYELGNSSVPFKSNRSYLNEIDTV